MKRATILIVDDEKNVRRLLGDALAASGHQVECVGSGTEALQRLELPGIDLLLLDLKLGDMDGVQVMQEARRFWPDLPIVMLTAHGSLSSAIAAVRHSASDYLLKPVSIEALRERVAQALERAASVRARHTQLKTVFSQMQSLLMNEGLIETMTLPSAAPSGSVEVYESGPVRINVRQHQVLLGGQPIEMTPSEFAILLALVGADGAVVSCSRLAAAIHTTVDDEEEARHIIRPHIVRLRRKIEPDSQQPRHLLSVRGVGYRWIRDNGIERP